MCRYADVIIDISHEKVDRPFQYRIPPALCGGIRVGVRVRVPFGRGSALRTGYVVELKDHPEYDPEKLKEIAGIEPGSPTVQTQLIELAWWMKRTCGSTMNQALKTVLPVRRMVKQRGAKPLFPGLEAAPEEEASACVCLNEEQRWAAQRMIADYEAGIRRAYLLYGVTGSGKTEVYMELMDHVIRRGRQVILLIPEIALTYQTVLRFYRRFGEKIAVMNSRLSAGERWTQWERAAKGEVSIMIGPRSALFAPFSRLGLIILDEEHEGAYKSETMPRYHARDAACERARLAGASVILGSATPSLESYTRALDGEYTLLELKNRAVSGSRLASVEIADMRRELSEGNKSMFSRRLTELIEDRLEKKEQIMLFINRRGYAGFVSCRSCGAALRCPHCDVSLTLHTGNRLVCHYCGYSVPLPDRCPSCGSPYIAAFGTGTQKLEEYTRRLFPQAKILRMDADTTSRKGGHEAILAAFCAGRADILIGTQMIVKGHDFGRVTLVGIMAADLSLNTPDYTSSERTFQLLCQAAGRAGRARRPGGVVIQTYQPDHYAIRTAADQDYREFYRQEMAYRRMASYPPACHMAAVQFSSPDEESLAYAAEQAFRALCGPETAGWGISLVGPAPAAVYKVNDIYRKILYIKFQKYDILDQIRDRLDSLAGGDERFRPVLIQYDIS